MASHEWDPEIELVSTGLYIDPSLVDGYVRLEEPTVGRMLDFYMNAATYRALVVNGKAMRRMYEAMGDFGVGMYLLPRSVVESDRAADLQNAIEYADLRPADACVMPGCIQDVVDTSRGFSVCTEHDELMRGWDSLVA